MQTYTIPDFAVYTGDSKYRTYKINDLPQGDKPREKLLAQGPEALSIRELMAVVLTTGTTKEDVLAMSDRIVREYGEKAILAERNVEKLAKDLDLPIVKACVVVACGELGRRFYDKNDSGF